MDTRLHNQRSNWLHVSRLATTITGVMRDLAAYNIHVLAIGRVTAMANPTRSSWRGGPWTDENRSHQPATSSSSVQCKQSKKHSTWFDCNGWIVWTDDKDCDNTTDRIQLDTAGLLLILNALPSHFRVYSCSPQQVHRKHSTSKLAFSPVRHF